jgi:hypothetical protein
MRPAAMIGFSIGGYLGWLTERMMVAFGSPPTRLINLDGAAIPAGNPGLRRWMSRLLPNTDTAPAARMLLLHRQTLGGQPNPFPVDAGWSELGVTLDRLPCRTLSHQDFVGAALLAGLTGDMARFIAADAGPCESRPAPIATQGGHLFTLLERDDPPPPGEIRPVVDNLPARDFDADLELAVLFLSMASGDAALALEAAREVAALLPSNRNPFYVEAAILSELGRFNEAYAVAVSWCARNGYDPVLLRRAKSRPAPDLRWEQRQYLFFSGALMEQALDVAAARCATAGR